MPAAAAAAAPASSPTSLFHNRRSLHVPFFPASTPPPPGGTSSSSSFPSHPSPSSSSSPPEPQLSFFPHYSPPPPQPPLLSSSATGPTVPADVSSLTFPSSGSASSGHHNSKLLLAVLLPLFVVALLAASLVAFCSRRRRRWRRPQQSCDKFDARTDSRRLYPSDAAASDGGIAAARKQPSPLAASISAEFVGALVNSCRRSNVSDDEYRLGALDSASGSPYRRLDSPNLLPLPRLPRQHRQGRDNEEAVGGGTSDEEYYSPRGSSVGKASAGELAGGRLSSSRRMILLPVAVEKCGWRSSTISTPSYPSSNATLSPSRFSLAASSPQLGSSPGHRSLKSRSARSPLGSLRFSAPTTPPPPPPLPQPSVQPLTPSPPKRKPSSPLPTSSPPEKESDAKAKMTALSGNPFAINAPQTSPGRQAPIPSPPPPPPPPPPGYWDRRVGKRQEIQQQVREPVKPVGAQNSSAMVHPKDSAQNIEAVENDEHAPPPKLKPLHWDKVRASTDKAMVWDQLKSSSFRVNEEIIQSLFVCDTTSTTPKEMKKNQILTSPTEEGRALDPKKSQNIAILLRALNVTKEEVCEDLLEGNADGLETELLETLLKMAPTKEEELKLKKWKEDSPVKLGTAEKFLKALLDIPFAFKRVDAMLYIANFDSEVNYLRKSFETLEAACEELRCSRLFLKLLDAVLKTGNHMNGGTNRGDAHAFKLDTLLKLVDVKGVDGKTTLLHFVVQEIIKDEDSGLSAVKAQGKIMRDNPECKKLTLKVVAGLGNELSNVKMAAAMDSDVLSSYVSKLAVGIEKISEVLRLNEALASQESGQRFHDAMSGFLKVAEDKIIQIQAQESVSLSLVKEITEYFHGNSVREEAHPFRIFMVVRDFLIILEQVCKEVGSANDRTTVSSGQHFPVPVNPTLLRKPVFPPHHPLTTESSDEDSF